ncbi:protein tramtrack, beta isoform [Anopheles nili]|uniref:protein tramtrack, beta isoform n=1 Tax=Anopheles nili TaxID=185578 RepID=UPI00237C0236|nr:protein tramtrack, beta isoform [Anopheles nili]
MASGSTPAYHCIVCTLTKIPFASLSKESQQKIVRNGRPTAQMPNLTARCMNSLNLHIHDWMTGCDRERKLYCWPCLLFNTSEYDVWGKRGFSDFYRLSSARIDHTKDVSHQAKSKTLKLWIETASELSDSSGEEDVECIPELDFLNATASELDEELDVKPNVEALNASIAFSQALGVAPVVDLCEAAEDGSGVVTRFQSSAIVVDCEEGTPNEPDGLGENSHASNASSAAAGRRRSVSPVDDLARIYKKSSIESVGSIMSHTIQTGAEKYQLKWHSHYQNMNISLSNLYKNDRYADVMLLTCNGEESYTIPAHKLILGTSSLYFANIFDKNPVPLNAITYIVLPPDLTYRSMQILIQYMYTGESTVSTDILNEVLRGGEILKIRGLWRNDCMKPANTDNIHCATSSKDQQHLSGDACPGRFVSPVTVTMPQRSHTPFLPHNAQSSSSPLINVKRDMAIDPGETRNLSGTVDGSRVGQCHTMKNQENIHTREGDALSQGLYHELHEQQKKDHIRTQQLPEQSIQERVILSKKSITTDTSNAADDSRTGGMPQELNFLDVKAEPVEWSDLRAGELPLPAREDAQNVTQRVELDKSEDTGASPKEIKSEDCNASVAENSQSSPSSTEQPIYSPLTCELCSETFTIPGEWVRHIEGHSDTSQTMPKRKRRTEESEGTDETAALRCDLCATFYVTPADWVRHVQSAHTESELAASNKRANRRRTSANFQATIGTPMPTSDTTQSEKHCNICSKSFPSYASMTIHKRIHTGEKPFYCEMCNKGFTVKSNLIRHMRSLHNQPGYQLGSPQVDQDSESSE